MRDTEQFHMAINVIATGRLHLEDKDAPGDPLVDALIMTARAIVDRDRKESIKDFGEEHKFKCAMALDKLNDPYLQTR